jgi:hypothetical protein
MLVNQGMLNQPTSLSILRDELTKLRDAGKTRDATLPARYEGKLPCTVLTGKHVRSLSRLALMHCS